MSKSIRYYYFTSIATVLVASVLVMGLIQIYTTLNYIRAERQHLLSELVQTVQDDVSAGALQVGEDMSGIVSLARVADAQVLIADTAGAILQSTTADVLPQGDALPATAVARIREVTTYNEVGTLGGLFNRKHYVYAGALYAPGGAWVGVVLAYSDATNAGIYVTDMLSSFVLSAGLVLLVSSMLALVLTNRTVIPIRRVSSAARRFGEGDYAARVPVEGDDELAQLAMTFNEMAAATEATDISRRSFMGDIAHELRTPMTSIKGFIDGMLDGTIPPESRDKYLKIVSEEVGRLARLTRNMLDISKLEAGENVPEPTTFDVWEPLATVALSSEQRLAEKHILLRMEPDPLPVQVLADEDYVHQVVYNLVDNALKFTPDYGTITVAVGTAKGFATVTVHNTGAGIPADTLPQIFDRFYKADKSRGLNAGGSGLGLHICKVLVGLMGGRIWAESEEGAWTAFKFTLPCAPAPKARTQRFGVKPQE